MPAHPKGSCLLCRMAQAAVTKVNDHTKKYIKLYAFFAILILEFLSLYLSNNISENDYVYSVYPLFSNIEFLIIFIAILYQAEKLKFCSRQKSIVFFLMLYYAFNVFTLLVPICWSDYYNYVASSILSIMFILFIATWRNI